MDVFCKGGGCTAKLGPAVLERVLNKLPRIEDPNLLVGFEGSDDASVYRLTEEIAMVQTLDFFPPMVKDPYLFGQIAAANALSDIYAMGGEVKTALNIVCFPEAMDLNILGTILKGGAEKVREAGGVLTGGHSIADSDVKYGLSVTGIIHPNCILTNQGGMSGDVFILTKPLGVGIIMTANRISEAERAAVDTAVSSMTTLNKYASEIIRKYPVSSCTDVTGFGFLGHLGEMIPNHLSAVIDACEIPYIPQAYTYAEEFYLTSAGQRNRNFMEKDVVFHMVSFPMEEIMFDPQTSGGLLFTIPEEDAKDILSELHKTGISASVVGKLIEKKEKKIYVNGG